MAHEGLASGLDAIFLILRMLSRLINKRRGLDQMAHGALVQVCCVSSFFSSSITSVQFTTLFDVVSFSSVDTKLRSINFGAHSFSS